MDILKWLHGTEQPQVPQDTCRRKHSRRQAKSDSSLLEPLHPRSPSVQRGVRDRSPGEASPSDCSMSSRYERRPRRKTRPERYEPNRSGRRRRESNPKKVRQKSRQKKKEKPGQVVQNFKAKNVSGDRLTLRPPELGLFNKGRTSVAVKGRGLPDLVFSEMKFLQKRDEPNLLPQPDVPKKRKRDYVRTKDGEISNFFTSGCPESAEQTENKHSSHTSIQKTKRRHRDQASMTGVAVPMVEEADQESLLGDGSRYPRHESTSYVSWSESIRAPSTAPARPRADDDISHGQHDPGSYKHCESKTDRGESPSIRPALPPVAKQPTDDISGRFRVSSLAPSYSRISRSQSCPQHSSSPQRLNLVDRSTKLQSADTACSPSSMPPAVPPNPSTDTGPRLSGRFSNNVRPETFPDLRRQTCAVSQHEKLDDQNQGYEEDVETSSDLGRVLQVCKDALYKQDWADIPQRSLVRSPEPSLPTQPARRQCGTSSHTQAHRIPTVRFAEPPGQYQAQSTFARPGIYEQQEQDACPVWNVSGSEGIGDDPWACGQEYMDEHGGEYYDGGDWDDMLEQAMPHGSGHMNEMCMAGGAFAVDDVREDLQPGNDVVAPGFWRPNKLY